MTATNMPLEDYDCKPLFLKALSESVKRQVIGTKFSFEVHGTRLAFLFKESQHDRDGRSATKRI
jgi:hypothetical protein